MGTFEGLESFFSKFTYKSNFEFTLIRSYTHGGIELRIKMMVPNSDDPKNIISVISTHLIYEDIPCNYIPRYILDLIKKLEIHEAEEWFKIDGKKIFNPHKDDE